MTPGLMGGKPRDVPLSTTTRRWCRRIGATVKRLADNASRVAIHWTAPNCITGQQRKQLRRPQRLLFVGVWFIVLIVVYLTLMLCVRWSAWRVRWRSRWLSASAGTDVVSFQWNDTLPDVQELVAEFRQCSRGLRESMVNLTNMSMMYTCDAGQEHRMLHGWGCVDAGARHLNQIRHHSVVHVEDYVQYEKEDRGHGAASEMVSCGEVKMEAAGEELDEALGPNVTVQLVRRGETCHSSYHLFSTGRCDCW
mmetsp:Transcript_43126/g.105216  ORF Transcript_43126/g.105216 Transcript_43126/m.105216 type:complete len:251 (-) Transcript_43126:919-1671(-)